MVASVGKKEKKQNTLVLVRHGVGHWCLVRGEVNNSAQRGWEILTVPSKGVRESDNAL